MPLTEQLTEPAHPARPDRRLTVHILDVSKGLPAGDVALAVRRIVDGTPQPVTNRRTNADGRTDSPLVAAGDMPSGVYEIEFGIGDYFSATSTKSFYGEIPVRFSVTDADAHIHIALLASPWSYTTYRGS